MKHRDGSWFEKHNRWYERRGGAAITLPSLLLLIPWSPVVVQPCQDRKKFDNTNNNKHIYIFYICIYIYTRSSCMVLPPHQQW